LLLPVFSRCSWKRQIYLRIEIPEIQGIFQLTALKRIAHGWTTKLKLKFIDYKNITI